VLPFSHMWDRRRAIVITFIAMTLLVTESAIIFHTTLRGLSIALDTILDDATLDLETPGLDGLDTINPGGATWINGLSIRSLWVVDF
jgi:hypothetical protein